jgi:Opioid growth factor receptor (OGFr) conserved region
MPGNRRITGFLSGGAPDNEGRTLSDIQQWSDQRLEAVHDFIQWMFPLMEPIPVNPDAPVLDRSHRGDPLAAGIAAHAAVL